MPISPVGNKRAARGVTLIELMVVVAIVAMIAGISFPAVTSGIDSLRLSSASESIVSFLNGALSRADRRQEVMEISVSPRENALWLHSTEPGFARKLDMPDGVRIEGEPASAIVMPGSVPPRLAIRIASSRGTRRIVRVDPVTGVSRIEIPEAN